MEMWKMRDWEVQTSHRKQFPDTDSVRGQMHCDRVSDQPRSKNRVSEHDDREARYWTRKLYEFEASDPDRWGHGGFKELYPEEFESDGEKSGAIKKIGRHKTEKSKSDTEACLSKRTKKSSRKKKKKKKKKKKADDGKRKKDESSSSECSSDDSSAAKDKQMKRKRMKSRHKSKKSVKTRVRDEDSSSGDSNEEEKRERLSHGGKKRKQDTHKDSDSGPDSKQKRRKNWKAADEENSDDSSAD
ncbi:uncharacterized protein NKAPD1 isoform 2-T3 [Odontesthes bonariensis]